MIDIPKSVAEAFRHEWAPVVELLRAGTFSTLLHDRIMALRIADALAAGLDAMRSVSDDDPRWSRTNLCRTASQDLLLRSMLDDVLFADPTNDVARWLAIAWDLYIGSNDFAADLVEPLAEADLVNVRWLVAGSIWVLDMSGVDSSSKLRETMRRLSESADGFWPRMRELTRSNDPHMRAMASIGVAVLNGQSLSSIRRSGGVA